ncbi:MAG TPA: hypothetical protein VF256_20715, partial [Streptosporangiaceae bacterium]
MNGSTRRGIAAPFALVTGFAALFLIGTVASALHGRFTATGVLVAAAAVVTAWSFVAEPAAAIPLGVIGWLTAVGFSRPPYAQLRVTGSFAADAAIVMGVCVLAGAGLGLLLRWSASRPILEDVGARDDAGQPGAELEPAGDAPAPAGRPAPERGPVMAKVAYAVGARRALLGVLLAAVVLPLLTA